ncbi:hypothetical protein PL263_09410 [Methylomonas sp. EFPC3]|uniref:hypothetical protein n=1 Tax=Methylomonas sp. EFPC3 TaxID=3021710 RepID=UPI002417C27A|nr:hypothetical protein [Methylomonas sp. EFPC3]WFP52224.1 hypothetical protein PL263_09410 [Methylomonas sp. EFPC3]
MTNLAPSLCITLLAATLAEQASADFMQWSNSEIQYLHGGNYHEPFNPNDVSQAIVTITHAHGWAYGRNFFFMDTLFSESGQQAQTHLYGEAYSTFSLSKIGGLDLSYGIFKDFGLTAGINLGENMNSRQSGFSGLAVRHQRRFRLTRLQLLQHRFSAPTRHRNRRHWYLLANHPILATAVSNRRHEMEFRRLRRFHRPQPDRSSPGAGPTAIKIGPGRFLG